MQVKDDDDLFKGQRLTQVICGKQCPIATYIGQKNHSAKIMMTLYKGRSSTEVKCGKLCSMAAILCDCVQICLQI